MNLRDTRSYSGHTRSKLPTKFLKFQLFRRIFGRFYPLWTCIFWVYVSWSCFMPKWQKYFSFWILQKSKNWFDILNFWFSHIHDYLDPWLFGSQEYPVSWLEFHRNYYCRMTSRKIQLLVNRRDMKKYDWKKKLKSFRFWRLILLLHWNVWALDTHPFPALALISISRILPSIPHKLLKSAIRSHNRT